MGRVFKPKYRKKGPGGKIISAKTRKWYIEYTDARGKTRRKKIGTSKQQASHALVKMETAVAAEKAGLPGISTREIRIDRLMDDYLAERSRHVEDQHTKSLAMRVKKMMELAEVVFVDDITPDAIEGALGILEDAGLAARTVNTYLQAIKGLLTWSVKRRVIPYNPLDAVQVRSERHKAKRRRPLTEEECNRLLKAALAEPVTRFLKIPGAARRPHSEYLAAVRRGRRNNLIYRIMLETGLRVDELRHLTWSDVDLNDRRLHCRESWTKNAKAAVLPLREGMVGALWIWKEKTGAGPGDVVVRVPKTILRTFDRDLMAAGIDKRDAAGRTVDLHALRHTYGQRLHDAGVHPKALQGLMRHSTPSVSLGIYIHRDIRQMADAVESLGEFDGGPPEGESEDVATALTGTDDHATREIVNFPETVHPDATGGKFMHSLPPNSRQGKEGQMRNVLERPTDSSQGQNAFQADDTGSNPVGTTIDHAGATAPIAEYPQVSADDTPPGNDFVSCNNVHSDAADEPASRQIAAKKLLKLEQLRERFGHLDGVFEQCADSEDPVHKALAEMWRGIKEVLNGD